MAGRVPAAPIVELILPRLENRWGGDVAALAERTGINVDTLGRILEGRSKMIDFDWADRLLCATVGPMVWYSPELSEIYQNVELDEPSKRPPARRCARAGCSNTLKTDPRQSHRKYCSGACRSSAHRRATCKTRQRGPGRKLEQMVCANGHERSAENTRHARDGTVWCLECKREATARWREKRRAAVAA